ncbi:hypothetical protein FOZ63_012288 [Perkinsus olseni]|uniref:Uncharacterized protein n=1 Tax=Perkinsus olseni TaxID=32597 RepID=A0A7J6Q5W3_PEROL|nr:hypothetical protein FOZ63_012288 [Perkinsus olseni]
MAAKQLLVAAATLKKSLNPYNWFASQPIHHPEFPPLTAQQLLVESNGASCFYGRGEVMSPYRQSLSIEVELDKGLRALKIVCPRNGTRKAFSSHFSWSDGSNSVKEYNRNYPYTSIKSTFAFKEAPLIDTGTDPLGDVDALTYYKELKRLNSTASKLALKNLTDGQKELMRKHLDELGQHGKDTANEARSILGAAELDCKLPLSGEILLLGRKMDLVGAVEADDLPVEINSTSA